MRHAILAIVLALAVPSVAEAGGYSFFFGFSSGYPYRSCYYPTYYSAPYYGHYYRPAYYGYYHGRYAVPRVYSPHRYHDYKGDRLGYYGYRHDYNYRRGYHTYDRGYYYGPAVERYHRNARDYPSYHYDRRETYNRGSDRSYRDRGDRYR